MAWWRRHKRAADAPPPVVIAVAHTGPEAEMIEGLLAGAGIPAMLRRIGPDLPYSLPLSPREVLVRADDAERAKALVDEHFGADDEGE
jgi:Putative prokaryotic signal transducing protein